MKRFRKNSAVVLWGFQVLFPGKRQVGSQFPSTGTWSSLRRDNALPSIKTYSLRKVIASLIRNYLLSRNLIHVITIKMLCPNAQRFHSLTLSASVVFQIRGEDRRDVADAMPWIDSPRVRYGCIMCKYKHISLWLIGS